MALAKWSTWLVIVAMSASAAAAGAVEPPGAPSATPTTAVDPPPPRDLPDVQEPPPVREAPPPAQTTIVPITSQFDTVRRPPPPPPPPPPPAISGDDLEPTSVHGLGLAGSFTYGSGLVYRRYFGRTAVQLSGIAIITDRGNEAVAFAGLSAIRYLAVWSRPSSSGIIPRVSALRFIGGTNVYHSKGQVTGESRLVDPNCTPSWQCPQVQDTTSESKTWYGVGTGIGFEFGALMQPGFSVALDLMLTAVFDTRGLDWLLPLPGMTLVYNW